jgi:RimJ/RimL family protein N-acetyltransferase
VIRWRAVVANGPSRRVAAAAGWRLDGLVRRTLLDRGELLDGWVATCWRPTRGRRSLAGP